MDFAVLIVPEAIPVPGTSVEVLQTTVAAMRTAAGEVCEDGEGIESSWQGLQAHYTAPESETLFAAMGPVAGKGGTILEETTTVADALEAFAEAAQTAQTRLRSLREDAVAFAEEMRGEEDWSGDVDNYARNRYLILEVNRAWGEFQEAERTCANAIAAVSGSGNTYVALGEEEPGAGEIAYGLDPDDVPEVAYDLTSLSDWKRLWDDSWHHLEFSDKPWPLDWASDAFVAQWDSFGPGMLWDVGTGALAATGLWSQQSGWASSVGEAADNFVTHKEEVAEGLGALAGLHGQDGWMNPFDASERSGQTWRANAGEAWIEFAHDLVPWREWEDRPAYTVYTGAGNAALTAVSLPVRGGSLLANLGRGGSDLPDLDLHERPEVAWDPGAAARPGFSLPGNLDGVRGDFSQTTDGFDAGLGDLSRMIDGWSEQSPTGGGGFGGGPEAPPSAPVAAGAPEGVEGSSGPREPVPHGAPSTVAGDGLYTSIDSDPRRIEREYERELELEARRVHEMAEDFLRRSPEEQAAWLRSNQLVGANALGGSPSGFGDRGEGFGITASHEANTGSGGPPLTPQDGHGDPRGGPGVLERTGGEGGTHGSGGLGTASWTGFGSGDGADPGGTGDSGGGHGDTDGDGSGTGGQERRRPRTLEEFRTHTWGDKDVPANQQAFREDLRRLLNEKQPGREYNDFYKEYYKENTGSRKRADTVIGPDEWQLPMITRAANGEWIPLEAAEQPRYLGERTELRIDDPHFMPERTGDLTPEQLRDIERREVLLRELGELDSLARDRRRAIDTAMEARRHLDDMEKEHGEYKDKGGNHPLVEEAKQSYKDAQREATDISEAFGERTAEIGAKFEFKGEVIRDNDGNPLMRHVVDEDGDTVFGDDGEPELTELRPNLEGATKVETSPFAPKNGNDQFDQIYRTEDGDIVIVEAKSSTKTELGERTVKLPGEKPRRVSQGTRAYLKDILRVMEERGNMPGNSEELILAQEIMDKLKQGRVVYTTFKGNPVDAYSNGSEGREWVGESRANGYDHRIFDISKKD